ncbi:MAG: ECF transporter S component [Lachnospiraceae bacterium]|nr:ECF transporter S component [Lachnospiraceae bacterium]
MNRLSSSEKKVSMLLLAALTCIATMMIKLPTPDGRYVNLGDGFALASGILFGPVYGALAAGAGSALSDLINGYSHIAPATFVIKALMATATAVCYKLLTRNHIPDRYSYINVSVSGAAGETVMAAGYFIYSAISFIYENGRLNRSAVQSAVIYASGGLAFSLLQAAIGIAVAVIATPLLVRLITRSR